MNISSENFINAFGLAVNDFIIFEAPYTTGETASIARVVNIRNVLGLLFISGEHRGKIFELGTILNQPFKKIYPKTYGLMKLSDVPLEITRQLGIPDNNNFHGTEITLEEAYKFYWKENNKNNLLPRAVVDKLDDLCWIIINTLI